MNEENTEVRKSSVKRPPVGKYAVVAIISVVCTVLVAAGMFFIGKRLRTPEKEDPPTQIETPVPVPNAEIFAEYRSNLTEIFDGISNTMKDTDTENEKEVLLLIDRILPLYDRVQLTTAPLGLEDADATLKEACREISELLELSKDILACGENPTADDLETVEKLRSRMTELPSAQSQIETALETIFTTPTSKLPD